MTEPFTVITLTGGRPQTLALCKKYLARQTLLPSQWVVVDDGDTPVEPSSLLIPGVSLCYVHRCRMPSDPLHTLTCNLKAAMLLVGTERIIFMEDDDWYSPNYLKTLNAGFDTGAEIVGQCGTVYYRMRRRQWRDNHNYQHASLCATGVSHTLFPLVYEICEDNSPLVDLRLWKRTRKVSQSLLLNALPRLHVGMKELPGRPGTTSGWKQESHRYTEDPDLSILTSLVGNQDAKSYERMISNV